MLLLALYSLCVVYLSRNTNSSQILFIYVFVTHKLDVMPSMKLFAFSHTMTVVFNKQNSMLTVYSIFNDMAPWAYFPLSELYVQFRVLTYFMFVLMSMCNNTTHQHAHGKFLNIFSIPYVEHKTMQILMVIKITDGVNMT